MKSRKIPPALFDTIGLVAEVATLATVLVAIFVIVA